MMKILRSVQLGLIGAITLLMLFMIRYSYVEHFPVASVGECVIFKSDTFGLVSGQVMDMSWARGTTSIWITYPEVYILAGPNDFLNSDIRKYGYVRMECEKYEKEE